MVKSLADELTEIIDWIENARLTELEHARAALVTFCRGLVCGLRVANTQSKEEGPMSYDEGAVAESLRRVMGKDASLQQKGKEDGEWLRKQIEDIALEKRE